jgi:hypothetical protein
MLASRVTTQACVLLIIVNYLSNLSETYGGALAFAPFVALFCVSRASHGYPITPVAFTSPVAP